MGWLQVACLSVGLWSCGGDTSDAAHTKYYQQYLNVPVAEIAVKNLYDNLVKLNSFKGKPVILNIWATWCPPCIKELPSLNKLAETNNFTVVAISVDARISSIKKFQKKYGASLNNIVFLHDAFGRNSRTALGFHEYPVTYLLNKNLVTKAIFTGPRKWESPQMINKLQAYLAE